MMNMPIEHAPTIRSLHSAFGLLALIFMTGCSSFLYYPTNVEHVDRTKMPIKPEDVYFDSEDGTKLHGWLFKTATKTPSKCVILHFHGNAQNLSTHFFSLYTAPGKGYDYLTFDYRGYGRSEGKPSPEGTVRDGRAALRWMRRTYPDRPIIVFGQSLGGAIALRSVLDMKNEVTPNLVIVDSTFTSYRSVGRSAMAKGWLTWLFQPLGWLLLSDRYAPSDDVANLSPIPLIVIHGDQDQVVDFKHGERLFEKASEPKEFWRVPGGRHTDFMWADSGKYAVRFYETLERYCK